VEELRSGEILIAGAGGAATGLLMDGEVFGQGTRGSRCGCGRLVLHGKRGDIAMELRGATTRSAARGIASDLGEGRSAGGQSCREGRTKARRPARPYGGGGNGGEEFRGTARGLEKFSMGGGGGRQEPCR